MTTAEKASNGLSLIALIVALGTFYFTSCTGPSLRIALSESILLNAKPRVGLFTNVQNDGARAGGFVSAVLMWDSTPLELVMTSPKVETWIYPAGEPRKNVEETQFTFVAPMHIQSKSSEPATLWFTRTEADGDRLFTSGPHSLELRLFDGMDPDPVARRGFTATLRPEDVTNIYTKGNELTEFRIKLSLASK